MLEPPRASIQPSSRTPGAAWQAAGGDVLSTLVPVVASVHR
jgi:hypothetical protein